ncbi:RDD family protein [Planococcus sp. YIM B11945]|uniref:RDD family protein n=1 Tax=Planococcus sp. YIM B11945 TaxID=3435410 RepID=UPI003D7F18A0
MEAGGMIVSASFFLRFKAFLLDYILIFAYLALLLIVNLFIFPSLQRFFTGSLVVAQFAGFLMVTLPVSLYFIFSDSRLSGQSFGKTKMGIRVIDQDSKPLSVMHAAFRTLLKFLPWELSHFLVYRLVEIGEGQVPIRFYFLGGLIYLLMVAYIVPAIFTKKHQSLYDLITNTYVIKK